MKKRIKIFLGVWLASVSLSVFPHAIMTSSQPAKEATLAKGPEKVQVCFNEIVGEQFRALAVITAKGKRMDNKDMSESGVDEHSCFTSTVKHLKEGKYYVRYRAESADGHIVTGKYTFYVGEINDE